ncbi:Methyltransferase domain [Corynebacterium kutscheri]|uniref:site-specific DNA-methyltransferase (adenine-specific) n=1 Tax=Corynebacterium kutscheri TaxID=35755 RepID=A0A0F6TEK7_9CORY|nr:DNA methyltransferase [Corynebacterium kutscheri]AKE41836.1 Methyltransferase domain [Corynebacterium kutscheri]VEH10164.1 methylase [Corynebacterium kutscheri]
MSAVSHISRSDIIRNLNEFIINWSDRIQTWKDTNQGHTEKSAAQQFWGHLLRCFGVIPERIDLFERDAVRASTNNTGYIDLFWSSVVIGEAKSLGKDLEKAEKQALDYLAGGSIASHEWPKFIIVTNFETIQLTKLGNGGWTKQFPLEELADHVDQLMFLAGREEITKEEQTEASIIASRLMADLFTAMTSTEIDEAVGDQAPTNPEDEDWHVQKSSVFLTRILFLLYGDDSGLWENDLFYRFILHDTNDENLGSQLSALFQVLNTPENRRHRVPDSMMKFPYVNGSLFAEHWPQEFFDHDMRQALLNACRFNWTRISPAIFGSMFQLVKSKEARRADGEHYTSETNILKVIEPLFLDGLRKQASRLIDNRSTTVKALREFRDSLAEMAFCDPACGCGNFLVVAYRELRKIETDIIVAIREREGQLTAAFDVSWEQKLSIGQFYGFELNWWPAKIAETAMFLVDHQANRELALRIGNAPERLPISITAHIRHGNALRIAWDVEIPRVKGQTFIFGNPPFVGHKERTKEQGVDLREAWGTKNIGHADYVTAWFAKSAEFFKKRKGDFAFVSTNSIVQGESVDFVFGGLFKLGWKIKFAHQTFTWDSEAPGKAAVHCVIVGLCKSMGQQTTLYSGQGEVLEIGNHISPYLYSNLPPITIKPTRKILSPSLTALKAGSTPIDWDGFVVEEHELQEVKADPIASKYLRPYWGGHELINQTGRWCLWLADDQFIPSDLNRSKLLNERVSRVQIAREKSSRKATKVLANSPHLFGEIRQPETEYLGIPQSFTERRKFATVQLLPPNVIASVKLFTVPDPDGFYFGLISSSMFITWQKTVGGRIKSDPSLSSSLVWNTFPVPELSEKDRTAIINGGKAVLEARAKFPHRSLADHYQPLAMDPDLLKAHDKLDKAVDKAFGAPRKLTSEKQRQELLFKNYAQLTQE